MAFLYSYLNFKFQPKLTVIFPQKMLFLKTEIANFKSP